MKFTSIALLLPYAMAGGDNEVSRFANAFFISHHQEFPKRHHDCSPLTKEIVPFQAHQVRRRLTQSKGCILSKLEKQLEGQRSIEQWQCELQEEDAINAGRMFVDLEGMEEEEFKSIESGANTLYSEFATISDGKLKIPKGASKSIEKATKRGPADKEKGTKKSKGATKNGRNLAPQVDARKILAVRIQANDSTTASSVATIGDEIFGNNGDVVNLRERFQTCSYGEMLMEPFEGTTTTGEIITGGVVNIVVDTNVNGADDGDVKDAAVAALTERFGDLPSQFDHVMLCIPPGTSGGWIAYGKSLRFW